MGDWFGGAGGDGGEVGADMGKEEVSITLFFKTERAFCHVVVNDFIFISCKALVTRPAAYCSFKVRASFSPGLENGAAIYASVRNRGQ